MRWMMVMALVTVYTFGGLEAKPYVGHTGRLAKRLSLLHAAGTNDLKRVTELLPRASQVTHEMVMRIAAMEDAVDVVKFMRYKAEYSATFLHRTLMIAGEFDAPRVCQYLLFDAKLAWDATFIKEHRWWDIEEQKKEDETLTQKLFNSFLKGETATSDTSNERTDRSSPILHLDGLAKEDENSD